MIRHAIISSPTYDPQGYLEILLDDQTSGLYTFQRRGTAVETLDGGIYIDDMGKFDAGRALSIATQVDDETAKLLYDLCSSYPLLNLSTEEGLFSVWPQGFGFKGPIALQQLVIVKRLDQ